MMTWKCLAGTGAWQRINTAVKLHSPRYPLFDLQDGQKYQFRVYSVNIYGSSEASAPSEPIQKVDEDGTELPVGTYD
ncbi:M-protein, striated muscle [Cyprinodon tularosa]|uniref:M-protein, striated muscle n=1 Tax=Cyprinodon tularosa TaxID=77115 RepID=UPI0018E1F612|nr:M-protein, striated muscle [Cyprinodon tularosa]